MAVLSHMKKRSNLRATMLLIVGVGVLFPRVPLRAVEVNQYSGMFGGSSASLQLRWEDDKRVLGGAQLSDGTRLQLAGSNYAEGKVMLRVFSRGNKIGSLELSKTVSGERIQWAGVGSFEDGTRYNVQFVRADRAADNFGPAPSMPPPSRASSSAPEARGLMSFEEAKQRAEAGDSFAQAVVALHYQLGWNTEKIPELAAKYASASANAGKPLGQFRLGALMREGVGVQKDEQRGLSLQAASFNGLYNAQDPYSMTAAGIMIFQGKVVGQNIAQDERRRDAARLYRKAADMGYAPAQFNYAMCAEAGHGIPKNLQLRESYLRLAADQNYQLAMHALNDATGSKPEPCS